MMDETNYKQFTSNYLMLECPYHLTRTEAEIFNKTPNVCNDGAGRVSNDENIEGPHTT